MSKKQRPNITEPKLLYHAHTKPFPGTSYIDVAPAARQLLRGLAKQTKRRSYVRSAYFKKEKVFLTYLWDHLLQFPRYQRTRRLKYLPCGVELIRKSRQEPITKENPNHPGELLHRFMGRAPDGTQFCVQIKEFRKTGRRELMSVFPYV